jgi:DNA-binding SARP family transcriptional activator
MGTPPLRIRLLGGFDLRIGDERRGIESPRMQSLLAYLALHRDTAQPRQRIAFRLWPDSTEKQALTNLRNLLHQLRRAVPELDDYVEVGPRAISLRSPPLVATDVADFEEALERVAARSSAEKAEFLEKAVARYSGDVLPGCYDEWLIHEQGRLRDRFIGALASLLSLHEASGRHDHAIVVAGLILRHDPLREDVYRALISAHTARGDRASALHAFHACAAMLERELGVAPDAATRRAYHEALGTEDTSLDQSASAGGRTLVGRDTEWSALLDAWQEAMSGRPVFVLVAGEAGIGKTRLAEELSQWAVRHGHSVAHARAYAADGALAYAPIVECLRSPAIRSSLDSLVAPMRDDLSSLLPELAGRRREHDAVTPYSETERRQRVYDAVAHAIHARALTLVLDDLQWCDRESLDLLQYLLARAPQGTALCIVGTARVEAIDVHHPVHELLLAMAGQERVRRIELAPLDESSTIALAEQAAGGPWSASEANALYRHTEGNPLFVLEMIRTGRASAGARPDGADVSRGPVISPRVHAVIESRLQELSTEARELAALAATVGREFDVDLVRGAGAWSDETLLRALDELWRRRIVRDRGRSAYDFTHDRIRDVAYLGSSPPRRCEYHLRVARALEMLRASDASASGDIAWHFDQAEHPDEASAWYVRAARAAHARSAVDGVTRPLRRALELLARLPENRDRDARELAILLPLGAALVASSGYSADEMAGVYRRAIDVSARLGRPTPPPVLRALALAGIATSDLDASGAFGRELVAAGEREADDVVLVEGEYVLGVVAFWKGELQMSREHLEAALARYSAERRQEHLALYAQDPQVVCLSRLAWTLWHLGHLDEANPARDRALALAFRSTDAHTRAYALWFTLFLAVEAEDQSCVHAQVADMQHVAEEHRLSYLGVIAESFAGYSDSLRGDHERGVARMEAALRDPRAAGQASVLRPQTYFLLARAHLAAGSSRRALEAARAGLEIAERGAVIWKGELHRLVAESLLALGADAGEVRDAFARAQEITSQQQASWTALRVATSAARWQLRSGTESERAASLGTLAAALAGVEGGRELAPIREAIQLLEHAS